MVFLSVCPGERVFGQFLGFTGGLFLVLRKHLFSLIINQFLDLLQAQLHVGCTGFLWMVWMKWMLQFIGFYVVVVYWQHS